MNELNSIIGGLIDEKKRKTGIDEQIQRIQELQKKNMEAWEEYISINIELMELEMNSY